METIKGNAVKIEDLDFAPETTLQFALFYKGLGISVIPVNKNSKLPASNWKEFQNRIATDTEINEWFSRDQYGIGIVTGSVSGITVIDCDSLDAKNTLVSKYTGKTPCVKTPKGWHYYFRYQTGMRNTVKVAGREMDVRGDGGFVVAPPSKNASGMEYSWIIDLVNMNQLDNIPSIMVEEITKTKESPILAIASDSDYFTNGRRDNDIYHLALTLLKAGEDESYIIEALSRIGSSCGFSRKDVITKVASAKERAASNDFTTKDVELLVSGFSGEFTSKEIKEHFKCDTTEKKLRVDKALHTMKSKKVIETSGRKNGSYRLVDTTVEEIDWREASGEEFKFELPLGIMRDLVKIYPKSVIVLAGATNAGKTSFLLETIRLNQAKYPNIRYMNSEMGKDELKIALARWGEIIPQDKWNFQAIARTSNWSDVVLPDGFNVIDYIEVPDEFWRINEEITKVHNKLDKGIAIIAIQKKDGADFGYGGNLTMTKPRLYINLDHGKIKIVKAKSFRNKNINPNGMSRQFSLVGGWKFLPKGDWGRDIDKPKYSSNKNYNVATASQGKGIEDSDVFVEE